MRRRGTAGRANGAAWAKVTLLLLGACAVSEGSRASSPASSPELAPPAVALTPGTASEPAQAADRGEAAAMPPRWDARFEAIAREIGGARVVALGELHEDGKTHQLKAQLVRYLHEELGFERVVLEAGLFSCQEGATALAGGAPAQTVAQLCAFYGVRCSVQAMALMDYLVESRRTARPLELSGIDPQLSGSAKRELLVSRLESALGEPLQPRARQALWNLFELETQRTRAEHQEDRRQLLGLRARLSAHGGSPSYWQRVLEGLLFLDEDHWELQAKKYVPDAMYAARDQQMADNLLWLLARHPDERFIVLNHNGHIQREPTPLLCDKPEHHHGVAPPLKMGQVLAKALGSDYVPIAFSAASGRCGNTGAQATAVPTATPTSVEFPALHATSDWIFLDHATLRALGPRVSEHMNGSSDLALDHSRMYDGLVVFAEMEPNQLRPGCER